MQRFRYKNTCCFNFSLNNESPLVDNRISFGCSYQCRDSPSRRVHPARDGRIKKARRSGPSGDEGARTPNPRLAKAVLSQLSYVPIFENFQIRKRSFEEYNLFNTSLPLTCRPIIGQLISKWACQNSNLGPHRYQRCALTS